jgi:dCTP deaminase
MSGGVLSDRQIRERARAGMINPFEEGLVRRGVVSFGVSSYGYDTRVGRVGKVFTNVHTTVVDPKNFDPRAFITVERDLGEKFVIPPNSFMLAETIEYFDIPRDILCLVVGKSTYARCGIVLNCTPAEPEWDGKLTLEISNTTPLPAAVYAGEGIGQMIFLTSADPLGCDVSYKDKKGKYQGQKGLTLPKVY